MGGDCGCKTTKTSAPCPLPLLFPRASATPPFTPASTAHPHSRTFQRVGAPLQRACAAARSTHASRRERHPRQPTRQAMEASAASALRAALQVALRCCCCVEGEEQGGGLR